MLESSSLSRSAEYGVVVKRAYPGWRQSYYTWLIASDEQVAPVVKLEATLVLTHTFSRCRQGIHGVFTRELVLKIALHDALGRWDGFNSLPLVGGLAHGYQFQGLLSCKYLDAVPLFKEGL